VINVSVPVLGWLGFGHGQMEISPVFPTDIDISKNNVVKLA
jgi:hypothetical protein